ncbi:MAG: LamG domain-containing protein, partial [Kiritimatiellia bacterium]
MKRNMAVMIMAAVSAWAAPKQAGYPFDGRTGFSVSNLQSVLKVDGFSVAAWVKVADTARPQMFLTLGQPNQDFSFYLYNGAVRMLVEGEPGRYGFAAAKPPRPEVWTHYLGTYDGKTAKIYRDGVLEGQQAIPLKRTAFAHPLTVGV